jgi:hypothetical protein
MLKSSHSIFSPKVVFFFLRNHFESPITNFLETLGTPQNRSTRVLSSLTHLYISKFNFHENIRDALVWCYWECLGKPFRNSMGTHLEQSKQKIPPPQTPKENNWAILNACWSSSLATWHFYFETIYHHFKTRLMPNIWIPGGC